eukprot:3085702-Amphidinium_carterae.1
MEEKQCHIAGWAHLVPDRDSETLESLSAEASALGEELWKDELPDLEDTVDDDGEEEEEEEAEEVEPPQWM